MRRFSSAIAFAATLLAVAGCPAPSTAADPWIGKYTGHLDSYRWKATIRSKTTNSYTLHASVASQMPLCSGDVDTDAKLTDGKLVVASDDCTLTITKLGPGKIRVMENNCNYWHGAACEFSSELTRK